MLLRLLKHVLRIPVPNLTAILTPKEKVVLRIYGKVFSPHAYKPAFRNTVNAALVQGLNAAVATFYGPYSSNLQKAELEVIYDRTLDDVIVAP